MRILLALLLTPALYGAASVSGIFVDDGPGPNCVTISYTVSGLTGTVTTTREAGSTSSLGAALTDFTTSTNSQQRTAICYGTPSAAMYFDITVDSAGVEGSPADLTCPVTCTNCGSSDDALFADNSGIDCTATEPPRVTMTARPADISPVAPTHANTAPYDYSGTETDTTCANFATDFTTAKTAGGTQILNLAMAGSPCSVTQLDLTGATNTVVIRPDIAANQFTTPYSQVEPDNPNLFVFRCSDKNLLAGKGNASNTAFVELGSNIILDHVKLDCDPEPSAPVTRTVTAVAVDSPSAGNTTLTLSTDCPTGYGASLGEVYFNLPGFTAHPAVESVTVCSGTSLRIFNNSFTGSLSGTGTVSWAEAIPVSGATTGANTRLTVTAHALPDPTSATGQHYVDVRVAGALGDEINGTHDYTVVDANTIELTGIASTETYTASDYDWVYFNSAPRAAVVYGDTVSNTYILRSVIGEPWYGQYAVNAGVTFPDSTGVIIRDSVIFSGSVGCVIDPATDLPGCTEHSSFAAQPIAATGASDIQIVNNLILDCVGICMNFQDNKGPVSNLTISQNHFRASDRVFADVADNSFDPASYNRWSFARHIIELKAGCSNCLIEGNLLSGSAVDSQASTGFAIWMNQFTEGGAVPSATAGAFKSVKFSYNLIERVPTCFSLGNSINRGVGYNWTYPSRFEFTNNICMMDYTNRRIAPRDTGSALQTNNTNTAFIQLGDAGEMLNISNNTFWGCDAPACNVMWWQSQWAPDMLMENNIFVYHRSVTYTEGIQSNGTTPTPWTTTSNLTKFQSLAPGSTSSFQDNLFIPGVEDADDVDLDKGSSLDADTVTQAECESDWPSTNQFTGRTCVDGSTFSARHATVFGDDLFPEPAYSAYGAGTESQFLDKLGIVRDVAVTAGSTTLNVSWTAPSTSACTVRLSADDYATVSTQTGSAAASQSVQFTGLTTATEYRAVIECPNGKPVRWRGDTL